MISKQVVALFLVTIVLTVAVSTPAYGGYRSEEGSNICLKWAKYGSKSLELCMEGRKK